MGWNKIANIQKGKIINCYTGQQIDLRSFFPIVEGNFMVLGSVASARADGIVTGGLRAVVEDLGNYNYRGWVQACTEYGDFDGRNYYIFLNSGETRHLGFYSNIKGYGFSFQVNADVRANTWYGQVKFYSDTLGDLYINNVDPSGNGQTGNTLLINYIAFDSNFYIYNGASLPIKCNFKAFNINWRNIEGVVQLYIQQTVT